MEITFFSSQNYSDVTANNGDCILIDTGSELVIFDCGCEEHAERVIKYMKEKKYSKAKLVLSHNDSDHFNGIPYLIDKDMISDVYTLLLLKYKDELLEKINDKRITRDSLTRRIKELFDNISSLSKKVTLRDIFTETLICNNVTIVGPDKEYALDAVAKRIDNRKGDTIDKETIVNAVSTQVKVIVGKQKLLLCGDSSFDAIKDKLSEYAHIQLPHHGKKDPLELSTMSLTILAIPTVVQTIYLKRDITLRILKVETRIVQLSTLTLLADRQDHIIGGFCGEIFT